MKVAIDVSTPISTSFRAKAVAARMDYEPGELNRFTLDADVPIEEKPWQIGLITGPSGSGKTLLARALFPDTPPVSGFAWKGKALVEDFPERLDVAQITKLLTSVGLASVPVWMRPYKVLSNGQKFRADLARALAGDRRVVFDEFTSFVDRESAKAAAYAVGKAVRGGERQFVAVTAHDDVAPWLLPDWIFDTRTGSFTWGSLQRPAIVLRIYRGSTAAWPLFEREHYLSHTIHRAAICFLAYAQIDDYERLVGFVSYIQSPGHKGVLQGHRTVVLPEFQGLGIGMRIQEEMGEYVSRERGVRVRSTISSPALNAARQHSAAWVLVRPPSRVATPGPGGRIKGSSGRLTCAWEYVPRARRA